MPKPAHTRRTTRARTSPARCCPAATRPHAAGSARACWRGIAGTAATCRGARPTTRTTSSSRRSCCSRRRSIACCRSTTSGSRSFPRCAALADAPEADVTSTWRPLGYNIRPTRLQSIAREAVASSAGSCRPTKRRCCRSRASAVHGRRDPQLRVPRARGHSRHQRRARAVPRVRRRRRSEEPCDEAAALARVGGARAAPAASFDFNQALMDFGATVCTARKPRCPACPLARMCRSDGPRVTRPSDRRHGRGHRAGRPLSGDAPPRRHAPRRPLGVPRRQMRAGRDAPSGAGTRARRGARRGRSRGRRTILSTTHTYDGADGRAAFLRGASCSARPCRSWDRRCDGPRARNSARSISRTPTQP